ncbi:hypothetical protein LJR231_003450 [Phyllobacterium sp. LjRoot231]|uniref:hypothetical protein n=1 Tax=Phyllobacterium sp. LjRoot231 TaxID=3342289 RepID=UPI003ED08635
MAFTKQLIFDAITIRSTGHFEIRMAAVVYEDGIEIAKNYQRRVVTPGDDVTAEPQKIKQLASFIWTQAMIDAARITAFPTNPAPEVGQQAPIDPQQ